MAAHFGQGYAKKSKDHECEVLHFADLLDCYGVSHNTEQGELPLMKDVFAWKEARHSSIAKATGRPANVNSKQILDAQNLQFSHLNFGRRSHGREKQMESKAFGTDAQRYASGSNSHQGRNLLTFKMRNTSQVDDDFRQEAIVGTNVSKHSSPSISNTFCDNTYNLTEDDFSLQHWMNPGCNKKYARVSKLEGQKVTTVARELRSKKLTRARRTLSPGTHVCERLHRECRKKRKLLSSRENCKLSPQNLGFSTYHSRIYSHGHHSPSLTVKQPMFVQSKYASRANTQEEVCNKHDQKFQCGLPFASERIPKFESQKLLTELLKARLLSLRNEEVPFCDDELDVSELPICGKRKPGRRFTGKSRRKTLPNSSRTCSLLSDLSKRTCGPSRAVCVKAQSESLPEYMLRVKKETEAMLTKSLACSSEHQNLHVEGSVKHADDFVRNLTPSRLTSQEGSSFKTQEEEEPYSLRSKFQSLSQKYRPKMFQDLIGQRLVARALSNAIIKGKVAPVYLFQGSHGTGKTSAARIFAMAINCVATDERKPCGLCGECTAFVSGKASCVWELDAVSHNGIGVMHQLIESIDFATSGPRYKIVIMEECHMFSLETWGALMKLFEDPPANGVFILITTEPDKLPLSIVSRCQRFHFLRIRHSDIVNRLDHIAKLENIFTEPGALNLIASKSDGSLRNAETVLDQVSLLEQRITSATIHKLVGSVSDDKLMSLLDLALCSDIVSTVQKTREIIDYGVDPLDLISQLATLITDILAGSCVPMETIKKEGCLSMHALSDLELERLCTALRILSQAERQVRAVSLYRRTWLTAALLQLGPKLQHKSEATVSSKSLAKANPATQFTVRRGKSIEQRGCYKGRPPTEAVLESCSLEAAVTDKSTKSEFKSLVEATNILDLPRKASLSTLKGRSSAANGDIHLHLKSPSNFGCLWLNVLKCCRPLSLRHLLQNHGKLLALSFSADNIVAVLVFENPDDKFTAEMYRVCITNSFKQMLGPSVEVQFSLAMDLRRAGLTSCSAAVADALCTPITSRHSAGCKGHGIQNEKESFDVRSSSTEFEVLQQNTSENLNSTSCSCANAVQPPGSISSCVPVLKGSAHSLYEAETTMTGQNGSRTTIPLVNEHFQSSRRWRLFARTYAKKILCDCVLASSMNANRKAHF